MSVYMKFEGVDGEAKDDGHDKWIDVLSTDWGMNKPGQTLPIPGAVVLNRNPTG